MWDLSPWTHAGLWFSRPLHLARLCDPSVFCSIQKWRRGRDSTSPLRGDPTPMVAGQGRGLPLANPFESHLIYSSLYGGEGGIRTLGTVARTLLFESSAFNHSATSPRQNVRLRLVLPLMRQKLRPMTTLLLSNSQTVGRLLGL
jgi:hypothetical protein